MSCERNMTSQMLRDKSSQIFCSLQRKPIPNKLYSVDVYTAMGNDLELGENKLSTSAKELSHKLALKAMLFDVHFGTFTFGLHF